MLSVDLQEILISIEDIFSHAETRILLERAIRSAIPRIKKMERENERLKKQIDLHIEMEATP